MIYMKAATKSINTLYVILTQ